MNIRNIAIIAHVDHGKTTLVDALLKQTHTFRDNQKEMGQTLIMDSNDLEREKGITILSKNTSVFYTPSLQNGASESQVEKINIIDTPGHADFGGEVERVINMASGAILLVDAAEGPLPQTRFVLKQALAAHLKIILIINKIDKKDERSDEVIREIDNLFLELAHTEEHLHFTTLYAVGRDGKVFFEKPDNYSDLTPGDLTPLFETIVKEVPNSAVNEDKPFQMLISTLDHDLYVGKLCIGKVNQGKLTKGSKVVLVDGKARLPSPMPGSSGIGGQGVLGNYTAMKLYTSEGISRVEVNEITSGDIVALAGIPELTIGQTVADPASPVALPSIEVEEPTIKVTIAPNTSPLGGKEGTFTTSRQIRERLMKEMQTNLGLRFEDDPERGGFMVSGRGELHLAILIETMRREGFEMEVSRPQVIYKTIDGVVCEPYEEVTIDVHKDFMGAVSEELGKRKGSMLDLITDKGEMARLIYRISSQNLIGIRSTLLTKTRGTILMSSYLLGYEKKGTAMESIRNGALVATQSGPSMTYGLVNAQERGTLFIGPTVQVYEGMVVGLASKDDDVEVNVCREKKLTNNRSSGEGVSVALIPATTLSLEQCLDFLSDDELLEVTPLNLRIRKRYLTQSARRIASRN